MLESNHRSEEIRVPTIASVGYSSLPIQHLARFVWLQGFMVADIRKSPSSRNPVWARKNLIARFESRYLHIPELGNENYKGGPIQIVDIAAGLLRLRAAVKDYNGLILLCVCQQHETCHRRLVYEALEKTGAFAMQILTASDIARAIGEETNHGSSYQPILI